MRERTRDRIIAVAWAILAAGVIVLSVVGLHSVLCNNKQTPESVVVYHEDGGAKTTADLLSTFFTQEDPNETEHINEALFAIGYLRHDVPLSIEDQLLLRVEAKSNGIRYPLALALIQGESNFDPENDNGTCYGYMALHRDYFPDDLTPRENLIAGLRCFGEKLIEFDGDEKKALNAYNAGHDTDDKDYAKYILGLAKEWAKDEVYQEVE